MKKISLLLLSATLFCCQSCFVSKSSQLPVKKTFSFDYTPKDANKAGSAHMVLAFVNPKYAEDFESGSSELFSSFQKSLGNDIEELIIAKGFTLKGPYEGFDEMVFDDKKNSELLIKIEIAPRFTAQQGGWKTNVSLLGPSYNSYSYSGKASLVGKINISGVEPLTNQKVWSKSVLIPNVENIPITTSTKYNRVLNDLELINDPGVYNEIGKALKTQYEGLMSKISAHFNVEEFETLRSQTKELKSKKGF